MRTAPLTPMVARLAPGVLLHGVIPFLLCVCLAAQAPAGPVPSSTLFDSAELLASMKILSSDEMQGREVGSPGGARARRHLAARFQEAGLRPFGAGLEQPIESRLRGGAGTRAGANVVGYVRGTKHPDRYIVVSAHYDHVGVRNGVIFNGANDNASGAAALPVIAAYFVRHPPLTSIIFAAFDAEEQGFVGSRAFVRSLPVSREAIVLNLNADMIGRDPHDTLWVSGTFQQPALKPFVERVAARAPVRLRMGYDDPAQGASRDWTDESDQVAFMEAGIPALYMGVEDFENLHKPADDYETMTHAFYVRAVETIIELVREFDAGSDRLFR